MESVDQFATSCVLEQVARGTRLQQSKDALVAAVSRTLILPIAHPSAPQPLTIITLPDDRFNQQNGLGKIAYAAAEEA